MRQRGKQNPILNLKQFQDDRVAKFATRQGHAATAKEVAAETGVSWRTIAHFLHAE